ncbi:TorF family putative porin [Cupriavidus basilensis]
MKLSQSWARVVAVGCFLAGGAGAAPCALAQEEPKPPASPHTVSANVALMSNYVFRGIT